MRVSRGCVDLIPPTQADQTTSSNVLQVVEVGRQEEEGEDKHEDTAQAMSAGCRSMAGRSVLNIAKQGGHTSL